MSGMNTGSLRFQLGLWYAGLLTAVFLLLGLGTIVVLKHYLEGSVQDSQMRRAHQVAQVLSPQILKRGPAAVAEEIEARFSPSLNNRFVQIRRADGSVLYRSTEPQDRSFDPAAIPNGAWPERVESARKVTLPPGVSLLISTYLVRSGPGAPCLVESGAPMDAVTRVLRDVGLVMA
jgi:hypothetical protein